MVIFDNPATVPTPAGGYSHVARVELGDRTLLQLSGQFDDSCGTDSESGHSHAGCARPSKQSLAVWPSPKQCCKVGHTISEPMEPVKQAGT